MPFPTMGLPTFPSMGLQTWSSLNTLDRPESTSFSGCSLDVTNLSTLSPGEEEDHAEVEASRPRERHHRQLRPHLQAKLQNWTNHIILTKSIPGRESSRSDEQRISTYRKSFRACKMQNAKCKMQIAKCKMQKANCKMQASCATLLWPRFSSAK